MRYFMYILLLLSINFSNIYAADVQNETAFQAVSEAKEETASFIPVVSISEKAALLIKSINETEKILKLSDRAKDIHASLKPYVETLNTILNQENYKDIEHQTIRELQKMQNELSIYLKQFSEWDLVVKQDIEKYSKYKLLIHDQVLLWDATYLNAKNENAPESILTQVLTNLRDINKIDNDLKIKYDQSLTSSQLIVSNTVRLQELQKSLKDAEKLASNRVFYKNQVSFSELFSQENFALNDYFRSVYLSVSESYNESKYYFLTNSDIWLQFFIVVSLILSFVLFYNYLYRKKRLFVREASLQKSIFFFIGRPLSTYTVLFILATVFIFSNRPPVVGEFILILIFVPVIRILQTVVQKKQYKYIYSMFVLWLLFWIYKNSLMFELESRLLLLGINLLLVAYVATLLYKRVFQSIAQNQITKFAQYLIAFYLFLLFISIGANLYGSVLLSNRIIDGVIVSFYSGMIFYALYVILTGYIIVILRRRISTASNILDTYSDKIEGTTTFVIKFWMFSWWGMILLEKVSLYPYFLEYKELVFNFSFTIADTVISISAILDFLMIAVGTWALARLTRTLLEVEIFARFKLPRGAPTAILTTINYVIIISGTIIAFSSLGVTPQQFTLVFGALGVGIGFGLRNIIANFVSGIIMVFERPIQIGDTIEVDKTTGTVQAIGARSSTVKTFDGSEVIVPNADFIAKEIINWTLSDHFRRKTVEFKVDLNNDIDTILELMHEVAESHKDVLKEPKPLATFKSFGEYYLEFKLYFWLSENLIVAQSEVNIGVYKALKEAGITMPIPKTNVNHL